MLDSQELMYCCCPQRARVNNAASSTKRQAVMNKHRQGQGLVVKNTPAKGAPKIRLPATRARQTSVMRPAVVKTARSRAAAGKTNHSSQDGDLDVSNIKRHFRTHPKKFTLPQGSNFRITVKYVVLWARGMSSLFT